MVGQPAETWQCIVDRSTEDAAGGGHGAIMPALGEKSLHNNCMRR